MNVPRFLTVHISLKIIFETPLICTVNVHSNGFTVQQIYTEVSTLLRTFPRCNLPLRSSAATLHVVGPVADLAPSSESAISVVRVRTGGRSMHHLGPRRQPVGRAMLGSLRRGLSGPRSGHPVRPGRVPGCQRLASAVSSSCSPLVPSRFDLASSARWRSGRLV